MNKTLRYYARRVIKTGEIIVEKSEILLREDYVKSLSREDPFEMISEKSPEYKEEVQLFMDLVTESAALQVTLSAMDSK